MSGIQAFMTILGQIWNELFGLTSPFWGLTFKQIFVGLFVVLISLRVLWPLLGLGAAAMNTFTSAGRRAVRSGRSSSSSGSSSLPKYSTKVSNVEKSHPRYFNEGKPMYKRTK